MRLRGVRGLRGRSLGISQSAMINRLLLLQAHASPETIGPLYNQLSAISGSGMTVPDYCAKFPDNPVCLAISAEGCDDADYQCMFTVGQDNYLTQCQAKADLDTWQIDTLAASLSQNWKPTGYYTSDIVQQIVAKQQEMSQAARKAATDAWSSATPDQQTSILKDRIDDLDAADAQAQNYIDAASRAKVVTAPHLKEWAIASLAAASNAQNAAEVISCQHDLSWGLITAFGQLLWTIGGVTKDVVKAAVKAGENVVEAVERGVGAIAWIVGHIPLLIGIAAVGTGGWYAYKNREAIRARFGRKTSTAGA